LDKNFHIPSSEQGSEIIFKNEGGNGITVNVWNNKTKIVCKNSGSSKFSLYKSPSSSNGSPTLANKTMNDTQPPSMSAYAMHHNNCFKEVIGAYSEEIEAGLIKPADLLPTATSLFIETNRSFKKAIASPVINKEPSKPVEIVEPKLENPPGNATENNDSVSEFSSILDSEIFDNIINLAAIPESQRSKSEISDSFALAYELKRRGLSWKDVYERYKGGLLQVFSEESIDLVFNSLKTQGTTLEDHIKNIIKDQSSFEFSVKAAEKFNAEKAN